MLLRKIYVQLLLRVILFKQISWLKLAQCKALLAFDACLLKAGVIFSKTQDWEKILFLGLILRKDTFFNWNVCLNLDFSQRKCLFLILSQRKYLFLNLSFGEYDSWLVVLCKVNRHMRSLYTISKLMMSKLCRLDVSISLLCRTNVVRTSVSEQNIC